MRAIFGQLPWLPSAILGQKKGWQQNCQPKGGDFLFVNALTAPKLKVGTR